MFVFYCMSNAKQTTINIQLWKKLTPALINGRLPSRSFQQYSERSEHNAQNRNVIADSIIATLLQTRPYLRHRLELIYFIIVIKFTSRKLYERYLSRSVLDWNIVI